MQRKVKKAVDEAREQVAALLGSAVEEIIFTSGGTESNNLAVFGLCGDPPGRILISSIEHPSLIMTVDQLRKIGFEVELIRVDQHGVCNLEHLQELLEIPTRLVCVMFANNETGAIQPVDDIAKICAESDVLFHCDAVQAIGKVPVSFQKTGFDSLSFTAHKFHGPHGVGGLLTKHQTELSPILFGGFQQMGIRPGTESVELILGMSLALEYQRLNDPDRSKRIKTLRDLLELELISQLPDIHVHAQSVERLPHTSNISFVGIERQSFLMAADMACLAVSTGSACSSGSSEPSHVLVAMGCSEQLISSSIRISLGADTTEDEILQAIDRICKIYKNLRSKK